MDDKLEMINISKAFASVKANEAVNFTLMHGETHVLIGENGAGKTTLMNILYGLYQQDNGEIRIDGKAVKIKRPSESIAHGIGMVHQHFMLVENLTVAENVVLGQEPRRGVVLDMKKAVETVESLCKQYRFELDPSQRIEDLSVGKQQKVEILKLLYRGADILILDEPTAVLTPSEIDELGKIIRKLNEEGKSVILITHKLREVMAMSDRLTVLRRGRVTGHMRTEDATIEKLVEMMVGKALSLEVEIPEQECGEGVLEVQNLVVRDSRGHNAVNALNFCVHRGEIVGLAGVDGNGQSEFIEALMGLRKVQSGKISILGKDITNKQNRAIIDAGISCVAEDRHKRAVVLEMSLTENTLLGNFAHEPFSRGIWLDYGYATKLTEKLINEFDVRTPSSEVNVMWLSGGNQQKYVVAREISRPHELLVAAQPTRGVDIGAKRFIHEQIVKGRAQGKGVLLVSTELDEILSLSDRIVVIYKGAVAGVLTRAQADERLIGSMMLGDKAEGGK
ncbi:MAG: ABC transporter ATP-binding protein [Oscillospiraceae bacterium]|jgi:simple sugar transport system ATP-binding protein|nr:ABC transporter ATP-binding protein [Oscillospiraceae bacterium]